jgi:HlyD family secretion protein
VKKLLAVLTLIVAAIAGGAYWFGHAHSGLTGEEAYTLAATQHGVLTETISATGLLQPHEVVAVGSELSGRVVEIYPGADVNKVVEEGAPLLRLDDRKASIELEQARIAVHLAQANIEAAQAARDAANLRVKRLNALPAEVGERRQVDEAEMQLKAAEATVAAAKVRVEEAQNAVKLAQLGQDLTIVRARSEPHDGVRSASQKPHFTILDRKVVLGQLIGPPASAQLFTLASDLGQMHVHAQVSENDIGKMRVGLEAVFSVYAYSEEDGKFKGKVVEIRPMPTNLHGAVFYDMLIEFANERDSKTDEWKLRPGMTAAVDVILRRHLDVWKVPNAALGFPLDEFYQSEEAKEKLARWQQKNSNDEWRHVWIRDAQGKPWPIFVRTGGKNAVGETGITDGQLTEVLEWDPDLKGKLDPKTPATFPMVITGAPPVTKKGFFDQTPNVRVF